ncbi:MAG TPA: hypothetical protein VG500_03225 [Gemmatimonadales bacterium]|jgi:hypothetical protein|nr:hypothetical protein [Gemmatimonadales bacterium]
MRLATMAATAMAFLAAAGCKPVPATQPAPERSSAPRRSPSTAATLGIPPGHLPAPGMCRVWVPGTPPGHQAKARSCSRIERTAPAGSWIVERPGKDKKVVHVRVVDERRPGVVVHMRVYEIRNGKLVREG